MIQIFPNSTCCYIFQAVYPGLFKRKTVLKVFRGQRTVTCKRAAIMMQRPQQGETLSLVIINHSWKKGVFARPKMLYSLKNWYPSVYSLVYSPGGRVSCIHGDIESFPVLYKRIYIYLYKNWVCICRAYLDKALVSGIKKV